TLPVLCPALPCPGLPLAKSKQLVALLRPHVIAWLWALLRESSAHPTSGRSLLYCWSIGAPCAERDLLLDNLKGRGKEQQKRFSSSLRKRTGGMKRESELWRIRGILTELEFLHARYQLNEVCMGVGSSPLYLAHT
ncbi:hypothetical protein U9M48_037628, partial [Paspalum notatum var. saurae]